MGTSHFGINIARLAGAFIAFIFFPPALSAQDGFASRVTGGAGGKILSVRTAEELKAAVGSSAPAIIQVEGTIVVPVASVSSNKTIVGAPGATIRGSLMIGGGVQNVSVINLIFTNPMSAKGKGGGDGITVRGGKNVWIDHCTFYDCADGSIDVTESSDLVTISWCKFYYVNQPKHRFVMLAMGGGKKNKLKLTLHHNWFAEKCDQRMPAIRNALVHMYNNYFTSRDNEYCTNVRSGGELLSESNFYEKVSDPCYVEKGGKIKTSKNIYKNCTGKIDQDDDKVFRSPYQSAPIKTERVPEIVKAGAGAR